MLKKILLSLLIGLLATIWAFERDVIVLNGLTHHFTTAFSKMFDCQFDAQVTHINLFSPCIILENVHVSPKEGDGWKWSSKTFQMSFSWWYLITHGAVNLQVCMDQAQGYSAITQSHLAISDHLKKMFCGSVELPILLYSVVLNDAHVRIEDPNHDVRFDLAWHSQTKKIDGHGKSSIIIKDGALKHGNRSVIDGFTGSSFIHVIPQLGDGSTIDTQSHIGCLVHYDQKDIVAQCTVYGADDGITCRLVSGDADLSCTYTFSKDGAGLLDASVPLSLIQSCLFPGFHCSGPMHMRVYHDENSMNGVLSAPEILLKEKDTPLSCAFNFECDDHGYHGTCDCGSSLENYVHSVWNWSTKDMKGSCTVCNDCQCISSHIPSYCYDSGELVGHIEYDHGKRELTCHSDYEPIRFIMHEYFSFDLSGSGSVSLSLAQNMNGISGSFLFDGGSLYSSPMRTQVREIDGQFRVLLDKKKVCLDSCRLQLNKGALIVQNGWVGYNFDDKNVLVHMPIYCDNARISFEKDMWVDVAGSVLLQKFEARSCVLGRLLCQRGLVSGNSLYPLNFLGNRSGGSSRSWFSDAVYDIRLDNQEYIEIDTPVLQGNAEIHIRIQGKSDGPAFDGEFRLHNSSIQFPYAPLFLSKAVITSNPLNIYDPLIQLYAKNMIKGYDVSLCVTGTLHENQVLLTSSPSLSQEEIIGLLFAGSQTSSLPMIVPAVFLQYIKNMLFDLHEPLAYDTYLHRVLGNDVTVHFVPHFADQIGRGGIRAALEIDVGERWNAVIQKNFSLTEDTRFQLGYALSDEMTLRGVRDERGDVTGEVEVRWKF